MFGIQKESTFNLFFPGLVVSIILLILALNTIQEPVSGHPSLTKTVSPRTSLVVQWLGLGLQMQEMRIQSVVRALRSHMPRGQKTSNRSNIATDSIKIFKWSTLKKKKKLCLSQGGKLPLGKPPLCPPPDSRTGVGGPACASWAHGCAKQGPAVWRVSGCL